MIVVSTTHFNSYIAHPTEGSIGLNCDNDYSDSRPSFGDHCMARCITSAMPTNLTDGGGGGNKAARIAVPIIVFFVIIPGALVGGWVVVRKVKKQPLIPEKDEVKDFLGKVKEKTSEGAAKLVEKAKELKNKIHS